jgi:hypothetical protein
MDRDYIISHLSVLSLTRWLSNSDSDSEYENAEVVVARQRQTSLYTFMDEIAGKVHRGPDLRILRLFVVLVVVCGVRYNSVPISLLWTSRYCELRPVAVRRRVNCFICCFNSPL